MGEDYFYFWYLSKEIFLLKDDNIFPPVSQIGKSDGMIPVLPNCESLDQFCFFLPINVLVSLVENVKD